MSKDARPETFKAFFNPALLIESDLKGNHLKVLALLGVPNEETAILEKITAFLFTINGTHQETRTVNGGNLKTAVFLLFLYYLALTGNTNLGRDGKSSRFVITEEMKKIARVYFGSKLCDDAENNSETKHINLRDILHKGKVEVTIFPRSEVQDNLVQLRIYKP